MNYIIHKPKGFLNSYIKFIWAMESEFCGHTCNLEKLVPSGSAEIIINLDDKITIKGKKNSDQVSSNGIIGGQKSSFSEYVPNSKKLISVVFHPQAAHSVFGIPTNEFSDYYIDATNIWGDDWKRLVEQVIDAENYNKKIQLLENFVFSKIVKNDIALDDRINKSIELLNQSSGRIKITELAEKVYLGKRQLERLFRTKLGLSPKEFSRIVRFQSVLYLKQKNNLLSLSELAYLNGYYDQSHFVNEFTSISGFSPKEFFSMGEIVSDYFSY